MRRMQIPPAKSGRQPKPADQAGFTLIELLIATLIFSLLLILITTGVLQFTRQYYKGVIASNTQNAARAIIDDVTRAIQFTDAGIFRLTTTTTTPNTDPTARPFGYCIGETKRYSFSENVQVVDDAPVRENHQGFHGFISDGVSGCSTSMPALNPQDPDVLTNKDIVTGDDLRNPRELLGHNMRLSKFSIIEVPSLPNTYTVNIRIIYGEDDLLCTPSIQGSCMGQNQQADPLDDAPNLQCKTTIGNQFCAVSELTTTVTKRIFKK